MNVERKFAKEYAGDLRKETAEKLREARKQPQSFKDLKKLKDMSDEYSRTSELEEIFSEMKKDIFGRIFKTETFRSRENQLSKILKLKKEKDIEKIRQRYQEKLGEILRNNPLTPEERNAYLSTEAMEKMGLEDYLTLLERLSGEAFYHVTRYGVRENTFMSTGGGHTFGRGKFVNNFIPLLKDGRIKDCTTTIIANKECEAYDQYIQERVHAGKSSEEIVEEILASYETDYFLDRESAHFSYGKDLHHRYGGENNYKFYFYYPVEYILHNNFYHSTREPDINVGRGHYYNKHGLEQQYNDFEIFNFGEGVPINAGVLCIASDVQVDPETGSQYLIENGKPVVDQNGEFKKPVKAISSKTYWENYFELHPKLKPSKVIYGNFFTSSYKKDNNLEQWAKGKEIHNQDELKKQDFSDYRKRMRQELREVLTKIVDERVLKMSF